MCLCGENEGVLRSGETPHSATQPERMQLEVHTQQLQEQLGPYVPGRGEQRGVDTKMNEARGALRLRCLLQSIGIPVSLMFELFALDVEEAERLKDGTSDVELGQRDILRHNIKERSLSRRGPRRVEVWCMQGAHRRAHFLFRRGKLVQYVHWIGGPSSSSSEA